MASLTPDQGKALDSWFRRKFVAGLACPLCRQRSWTAAGIVMAPEFAGGNINIGSGVPVVQIVCDNCSYVASIAAIPTGVIVQPPQP